MEASTRSPSLPPYLPEVQYVSLHRILGPAVEGGRGKNTIDNRPKTIYLDEVPAECDDDQLKGHFGAFAEVEAIELIPSEEGRRPVCTRCLATSVLYTSPCKHLILPLLHVFQSALIKFADRPGAELAMQRARSFAGEVLDLSWHTGAPPSSSTFGMGSADQNQSAQAADAR